MNNSSVIPALTVEASLKRSVRRHLSTLGFRKRSDGSLYPPACTKEAIRQVHAAHRADRIEKNRPFIKAHLSDLKSHFAAGSEIVPEQIQLRLHRVAAGTPESALFRLAALTWSVPVSSGYGRRLRYLVWDDQNSKLAGLIALGDPVFNLSARDRYIGWDKGARTARLTNMLDAYALGAVPPYSFLLGGKAVACLLRTREIYNDFYETYGQAEGIISGLKKGARLLAITTSSSLGRSSIYNRLNLNGERYLRSIGFTEGWGHFHIPDALFEELREYLRQCGHGYADQHRFGNGPNWKLRTIRVALSQLGLDAALLRHGIRREVFICELASNARRILSSGTGQPDLGTLRDVAVVSDYAVHRWMIPRAQWCPAYRSWHPEMLAELLVGNEKLKAPRHLSSEV
jgi:Domain of unknown function (DUF4338)